MGAGGENNVRGAGDELGEADVLGDLDEVALALAAQPAVGRGRGHGFCLLVLLLSFGRAGRVPREG